MELALSYAIHNVASTANSFNMDHATVVSRKRAKSGSTNHIAIICENIVKFMNCEASHLVFFRTCPMWEAKILVTNRPKVFMPRQFKRRQHRLQIFKEKG